MHIQITPGPHVDKRAAPEKSSVTVILTIPSLGKKVTIERGVKAPRRPKITPNTADVLQVLRAIEAHPEVVLSRREIIRYVLATPGAARRLKSARQVVPN